MLNYRQIFGELIVPRKPTSPQEALRQLQEERAKPFWRKPGMRMTLAAVVLALMMGVFQKKFDQPIKTPQQQAQLTTPNLDSAKAYFTRARVYLEHDRPEEAISDYNHVLKANPKSFLAWQGRGQVAFSMGDYPSALADFTKALELRPQSMEILNNRALTHLQLGQAAQAVRDYQLALKYTPDSALLMANLGLAHQANRESELALKAFQQAQQINPDYLLAKLFEGNYWLAQKRYKQALPLYDQVLGGRSDQAEAWHNRGLAYQGLKQCKAANYDFKQACELGYAKACKQKC